MPTPQGEAAQCFDQQRAGFVLAMALCTLPVSAQGSPSTLASYFTG
jgi:hypothetical protein